METHAVERSNPVTSRLGTVRDFLVAVQAELKKVTWPTRDELVKATRLVVIWTLAIGIAIGVLDRVLGFILVDGVAALAR